MQQGGHLAHLLVAVGGEVLEVHQRRLRRELLVAEPAQQRRLPVAPRRQHALEVAEVELLHRTPAPARRDALALGLLGAWRL